MRLRSEFLPYGALKQRTAAGVTEAGQTDAGRDAWALVAPKEFPRPVFVVGMNGSGTSMLTECLGRHPALYSFPGETRMIPHLMNHAGRGRNLDDDEEFLRLWSYVLSAVPSFADANHGEPISVPTNWRECGRSIADVLDAIFGHLAGRENKSRWCEKSPNNSEHLLKIKEHFPGARFVHIIRDGRDCAASTHRRQHRTPELTMYRWRLVVEECRRQGRRLAGDYLELRYEDLTTDSELHMRNICSFLDLEFDPVVLQSAMPQSELRPDPASGQTGQIVPNSMRWKAYFDVAELRKLELIAGDSLAELGYPILFEPGNRNPSWIQLKTWRARDFVRANRRLQARLSGDTSISWGEIIQHTVASIREYRAKRI